MSTKFGITNAGYASEDNIPNNNSKNSNGTKDRRSENEMTQNDHLKPDDDTTSEDSMENYTKPTTFREEIRGCDDGERVQRFRGPVFRSLREKRTLIRINSQEYDVANYENDIGSQEPELQRSEYSLVSCGDLSPAALELWLSLPEEVKFDPSLVQFRNKYEKEHGTLDRIPLPRRSSGPRNKRLPLVSSAPHLVNNLEVISDEAEGRELFFNNNNNDDPEKVREVSDGAEKTDSGAQSKPTRMAQARFYVKMTMLLACWLFFTVMFLMYSEREEVFRNTSVEPNRTKEYKLSSENDIHAVQLTLTGPFVSFQDELRLNRSQFAHADKLEVWLRRGDETSGVWSIILDTSRSLDFTSGEERSKRLDLTHPKRLSTPLHTSDHALIANSSERIPNSSDVKIEPLADEVMLVFRSSVEEPVPLRLTYNASPIDASTGVILSCVLLGALYVLIIFEVINRALAALLVSTAALGVLGACGARPSLPELVGWLDAETLLLLFSMMLLVALTAETGMFDYLAVYTFEVTKGRTWPLINLLCFITAILSTVLDNVTTVLLMTPVTIRLCEVMELDPVPILMSMVLYSNIGGTATPVGDPPNVIIASNRIVIANGINFTNFSMHMGAGILLVLVQTYFQLRFYYRDTSTLRLKVPSDIQELRQQMAVWRRAADSLPSLSKDQSVVKERLDRKIGKLAAQLARRERDSSKRAVPKDSFQRTLAELKAKYKIRNKVLLVKCSISILFVVTVFFLHAIPEFNRVSLGWTALLGALLLLLLADREDLEPVLLRVEWSTLLFFAALFVLMEALTKLGLIDYIGGLTEALILRVDEGARLAVALLLLLWVSGLTSAFVDNIPLTTMMVRVATSLGSNPVLGLPMAPLVWALAYGACLGGNGTLIGASANVVCAGAAEQHGYKFTFTQFFRLGFPVMLGHLLVASAYLLLCHCVFTWH